MRGLSVVAGAFCLSGCSFLFALSDDAASGASGAPGRSSDASTDLASQDGSTTVDVVELLRDGLTSPDNLMLDATSLTWLEPGTPGRLVRAPLEHWRDDTVLASGQKNPYRAIEYGGGLYWTTLDDGLFHRLDATGDVAYGGATEIGGLAGAGNTIFFAYGYNGAGSLEKCTPTECIGGAALYYPEKVPIQHLRSTTRGLAWIEEDKFIHAANTAEISVEGGVYVVAGDPTGVATFASDADYFYVAGRGGGVVSLPLTARDGAGAQTLLGGPRVMTSLASDGRSLFFASDDGRISMTPRLPDSGAPTDLAHTKRGPVRSLVVGDAYVYWSEGDAIFRVRKSP